MRLPPNKTVTLTIPGDPLDGTNATTTTSARLDTAPGPAIIGQGAGDRYVLQIPPNAGSYLTFASDLSCAVTRAGATVAGTYAYVP